MTLKLHQQNQRGTSDPVKLMSCFLLLCRCSDLKRRPSFCFLFFCISLILSRSLFNHLHFLCNVQHCCNVSALGCFYFKLKACREGRDEAAASTAARSWANLQPADLHTRMRIIALKRQQWCLYSQQCFSDLISPLEWYCLGDIVHVYTMHNLTILCGWAV